MSKEPRRILFFSTFVSRESGASYAMRLAIRRLEVTGIHAHVVVPDCAESRGMFPEEAFNVSYLKIRRPRKTWNLVTHSRYLISFPATLFALKKIIRERSIDLVHFNEITDFIAGFAGRICGVPCVCHVRHDGIPQPYRHLLVSMLRKTTDAIIVPSKSTAGWITSDAVDLTDKVNLIYDYAFDLQEYRSSVSGENFRRERHIPADAILVVLVSKLSTPKGHQCFIRAAEKVVQSAPNVHFVIVGGPIPGHEQDAFAIKQLAEELIPSGRLQFVGPRSDLPEVYSACDIAVHCPIYPDTYPTVVLLPMLMGKPVVGSNIGGIPEQIDNGKTGMLVPPNDPAALAAALLSLVENPARRGQLGRAAETKIRQEAAPRTQGELLSALYERVLGRQGEKGLPHA